MSASPAPELDAIALQVLAALETYDADVEAMLGARHDPELYHRVSHGLDRIRMDCASIGELRVHWVELLIAHAELVHRVWRDARTPADAGDAQGIEPLRDQHRDAVVAMRDRCRSLVAGAAPVRRPGTRGN